MIFQHGTWGAKLYAQGYAIYPSVDVISIMMSVEYTARLLFRELFSTHHGRIFL